MLELNSKADLQRLIDEQLPESLTLEYKSSPALNKESNGRNELVKDVSAFANSAGGQIIYGIKEKNQKPLELDDGVDRKVITPEWIEQIINSGISPRIQGVIINIIPLSDDGERVAYLLSIPEMGSNAPYQSLNDQKYYRRYNFQSVAMYDYEIRNILNRKLLPSLLLDITINNNKKWDVKFDQFSGNSESFYIGAKIGNNSPEPCLYSIVNLYIDERISCEVEANWKKLHASSMGIELPCNVFYRNLTVPNDMPVFKEASTKILHVKADIRLHISNPSPIDAFIIGYEIFAPGCHKREFGKIVRRYEALTIEF